MANTNLHNIIDQTHGQSVWSSIVLKPNLILAVWFVSWLLSKILPYGTMNFIFALIAFGAGFTWAWLELFEGTHWIRRVLGLLVLIVLITSQVS